MGTLTDLKPFFYSCKWLSAIKKGNLHSKISKDICYCILQAKVNIEVKRPGKRDVTVTLESCDPPETVADVLKLLRMRQVQKESGEVMAHEDAVTAGNYIVSVPVPEGGSKPSHEYACRHKT